MIDAIEQTQTLRLQTAASGLAAPFRRQAAEAQLSRTRPEDNAKRRMRVGIDDASHAFQRPHAVPRIGQEVRVGTWAVAPPLSEDVQARADGAGRHVLAPRRAESQPSPRFDGRRCEVAAKSVVRAQDGRLKIDCSHVFSTCFTCDLRGAFTYNTSGWYCM